MNEAQRRYYKKNREKILAKQKEYNARHKEEKALYDHLRNMKRWEEKAAYNHEYYRKRRRLQNVRMFLLGKLSESNA